MKPKPKPQRRRRRRSGTLILRHTEWPLHNHLCESKICVWLSPCGVHAFKWFSCPKAHCWGRLQSLVSHWLHWLWHHVYCIFQALVWSSCSNVCVTSTVFVGEDYTDQRKVLNDLINFPCHCFHWIPANVKIRDLTHDANAKDLPLLGSLEWLCGLFGAFFVGCFWICNSIVWTWNLSVPVKLLTLWGLC